MRTDVMLLGLASLLANASASEGGLSQHKPFLRRASVGDARGRSLQSATTQTCSNGIEGIESANGGVCCPTACGVCGGEACTEAAVNAGLDDGDCCFSDITIFGASCSENQMAPCIIDDASQESAGDTCSNTDGVEGISSADGDVCCPSECGLCGGRGCTEAALAAGLADGDCCVSDITNEGVKCSDSGAAPCVAYDSEDESGSPLVQESSTPVYITLGCGKIGDYEDPFTVSSMVSDLTAEACYELCASESSLYFGLVEGNVCSCGDEETFVETFLGTYDEQTAGTCSTACPGSPDETCGGAQAFDLYRILPTCTGGIVGVEAASGDVCCPFSCGECGGDRCVGEGGCCEHTIQSREGLCQYTNAAPCVFNVVAPPPTPVPAPTTPMPTRPPAPPSTCTGDIPGLESDDGTVCCMEHCSSCRIESADECVGVPACCQEKILLTGVKCSDEGVEEGPCILM